MKDDKCLYDDFLKAAKKRFHIDDERKLKFAEDFNEIDELETLIEDISLANLVLPKCHKPLKSISRQIQYQAYEIRTRSSMLRVYYIKEKTTGKVIILGHVKSNQKDQIRELKRVVRIAKEYYNYQLKHAINIIK